MSNSLRRLPRSLHNDTRLVTAALSSGLCVRGTGVVGSPRLGNKLDLTGSSINSNSCRRLLATGTRGSRGHGWYQNYRAGKGGRHLQGEYHNRESVEECAAWNDAVLQLGCSTVYMDIVAEPRRQTTSIRSKKMITVPPLDSLQGERYRIEIEVATTVMPETTQNFINLLTQPVNGSDGDGDNNQQQQQQQHGYLGTRLYRIEKNVGLCGGDVLTNTGKTGMASAVTRHKSAHSPLTMTIERDPLALWHIPGTVTMLVPKVGEIDSRFMLVTQHAPHIDGMCRAFGRMTESSLAIVRNWQVNLLTRDGIPTAYDLIVAECGLLTSSNSINGGDNRTSSAGSTESSASRAEDEATGTSISQMN